MNKKKYKIYKRILSTMLCLVLMLTGMPITASAQETLEDITVTIDTGEEVTLRDADGDGYYDIGNVNQLYALAALVNAGTTSINAELTSDISVNGTKEQTNVSGCNGVKGEGWRDWAPIGNSRSNPYTGMFNGGGYIISGLYFNDEAAEYVGLFGYAKGEIKNVAVVNSYFKGSEYVGGVCGEIFEQTITNCYNTGTVSGAYFSGGVCGLNYGGTIEKCYNTGVVSGERYIGGVCGQNGGTVTICYNIGGVSGEDFIGGVCGENGTGGGTTNSYNVGVVSGTGRSIGGVCGANNTGEGITNSYNVATVSGTGSSVGGVCGTNDGGTIANSYNAGAVSGSEDVGGVCGRNLQNSTIENCYYNNTVFTGSEIDSNYSTKTNVLGKSTDEFKSGEVTYLLNGTIVDKIWNAGPTNGTQSWYQTIGTDDVPVLTNTQGTVYSVYKCDGITTTYRNVNQNEAHILKYSASGDTITAGCSVCDYISDATIVVSASDKTYDGEAATATIVNNIDSTDYSGFIVYRDSEGTVVDEAVNAGTYTANLTIENTDGVAATASVTFTITRATLSTLADPTASAIVYGQALSASVLTNGWAWVDGTIVPTIQNNGYAAYFEADDANYDYTGIEGYDSAAHTVTRTIPVTVNKANTTYTAPTASTLVYNGAEQELISTDTVTGGTMLYSPEENGTYSETIPTGKNAGNYIVWYKVVGDENHNDVTPESVAVTIGKATPTISVDVSSGDLSPGTSVVIEALAKNPNNEALTDVPGITCTYRIGDAVASEFANGFSIPKGTAVGTVITITASTAEDANYAAATKTITVTVEACNHTGGTQTCKGYQCANCGEWYGDEGKHTPDMYGKCTTTGCDKQYEAKIGGSEDTDISCFYDKITDAFNAGGNQAILHVLADVILTEDAVLGGFYRMYMNGHTITLNDGSTLTVSGVHLHGEGRIIGNVEGPLVISNGLGPDWVRININNSHANGYAMQVNQTVHGGLVLNGSKADILLPSEEARVGIDIYEENQVIRIAYAEGVDPIGAWLWVPQGGGYEGSVWKHYELVSPQGYVLVEEYDEITGSATGIRVKKPITADMVKMSPNAGSYGETHSPTIVVTYKNETLVQGRDYTVETPANMSGIGSYTYTITGMGDRFAGEAEVKYIINKADISAATISLDLNETLYYNGGAITPAVGSVVLNNTNLVKDTDYTVSYTNNTNAGTATVTVTGKGNYTGTASTTFTINKATPVVTVPTAKDLTYSGQAQTLVNAGRTTGGTIQYSTLENGTYSTNIPEATDVGTYTVWYKVVGGDNYLDTEPKSVTIVISPKEVTAPTFADMEEAYDYTGDGVEPTFTLKDEDIQIPATEYEVRYQNNVNVGIASIVITDKAGGNYTVSGTGTFVINKATPIISVAPTVAERTYHPSVALADSDLNGGSVTGVNGSALEGSWSFTATGIVPDAGEHSYEAVFTPNDSNYKKVTVMVTVKVNKAVATVEELPVAAAIVYGKTLGDSALSGGKMVNGDVVVPGTYEWMYNGITPAVADSNSTTYAVMFVPDDMTNYDYTQIRVSLTVNKANPTMEIPSVNADYGQTLQDVDLPDGWAWEEESASVGDAGTRRHNAIYTPEDTDNYNIVTREIAVNVAQVTLTIVSVDADDRVFNGTNQVNITGVTLNGILNADDVAVEISANKPLIGTLESTNVGTYTKVQLQAQDLVLTGEDAGNYNIAVASYETTDVTITKAEAYSVADVNAEYIYTVGSEDIVEIDIAKLLKSDRGETMYTLTVAPDAYMREQSISENGMLSYMVYPFGNKDDVSTITVTVASQNYEDVTVSVVITLTDKITVEEKADAKVAVAGNLVYGQSLVELEFADNIVFVEAGKDVEVPGVLSWDMEGNDVLDVGSHEVNWRFAPDDTARYKELTGMLTITVEKAPIVADRVQITLDVIERPYPNMPLPGTVDVASDLKYSISISWDPADEEAGYNTVYTAKAYLTAMPNYTFAQDISLEDWEVVSNTGAVLVVKRTFGATDKACIVAIDSFGWWELEKLCENTEDVIALLPDTILVYTEKDPDGLEMPITWSCESYDNSYEAENIFIWTIVPESYADYDTNGFELSGELLVINPIDQVEQFVRRLYGQFLSREADEEGLRTWVTYLRDGEMDAATVVEKFVLSDEFVNSAIGDEEYVYLLYNAILDREPEADGFNFWMNALAGGMTKQEVLAGFTHSVEFDNLCDEYGITAVFGREEQVSRFVERMYTIVLSRPAEPEGLAYWAAGLLDGSLTGSQMAKGFLYSEEFIGRNTSDEEYIKILYRAFLDREAEDAGLAYWKEKMQQGMSRDEVLGGFIYSVEFSNICAEYGINAGTLE